MLGTLASEWPGLGRAVDVLFTVARRELQVEVRQRTKFVLDLTGHVLGLMPVVMTAWAAAGGGVTRIGPGGVSWLTFVVLGYVAFAAFGVASPVISFTGMAFALGDEQQTGTLERNLLVPAPRLLVVLGSGVYYTALFLFHVVSLLAIAFLFLPLDVVWTGASVLTAGVVLALIVVLSVGFGVLSAGIMLAWRDDSLVMILIHRPMLLMSGAYFLLPTVPEPFRTLAWLNPIAYAVDAFRGSLTGATVLLPLGTEIAVLAVAAVAVLAAGLYLFERLMASWLRTGSLGAY
jgi:ABC-type multidrug transport system permease subunit